MFVGGDYPGSNYAAPTATMPQRVNITNCGEPRRIGRSAHDRAKKRPAAAMRQGAFVLVALVAERALHHAAHATHAAHAAHAARRHAPAPADFSSGFSAIIASVVSSRPATDAAFCSAVRTTLVGSTMPAFIRSSNSSVAALKPKAPLSFFTLSSTIEPSQPALLAIQRQRILDRAADDVDADLLLGAELEAVERRRGADQRHAAARDDALLDRRAGRVQRVLDARLLLLHLDLGRRADADHRHAADQLRQPLLQLLAVVVRGRLLDLGADLLDAALDVRLLAGAVDDRRVVLVDRRCAWRGRGR